MAEQSAYIRSVLGSNPSAPTNHLKMEFKDIIKRAQEIQKTYRTVNKQQRLKVWGVPEYMQGFVGDVGDLVKLVMVKENFLQSGNIDRKLARELSDCLWSVIIISKELEIDLEKEFLATMNELEKRLHDKQKKY